jgi:hypothetical protein
MADAVTYTVFERGGRLLSIFSEEAMEAQEFLAGCLSAFSGVTSGELAAAVTGGAAMGVGLSIVIPREPQVVAVAVTYGWGFSVCLSLVAVSCGVLMVTPFYILSSSRREATARVAGPPQAMCPTSLPSKSIAVGHAQPPPPAVGSVKPPPPAVGNAKLPPAVGPAKSPPPAAGLATSTTPATGSARMPVSTETSRPVQRRRMPNGVALPPGPKRL